MSYVITIYQMYIMMQFNSIINVTCISKFLNSVSVEIMHLKTCYPFIQIYLVLLNLKCRNVFNSF